MAGPETSAARSRCWLMAAALLAAAAGWHTLPFSGGGSEPPSVPAEPKAFFRPDGGQALSAEGLWPLTPLSRLALGRRIDFAAAGPSFLCALPGLGRKSALKAVERGRLNERERRETRGYLLTPDEADDTPTSQTRRE